MGAFALGVLFITSAMVLAVSEFYGNFDELSTQAVEGVEEVTSWLEGPPLRLDVGDLESGLSRALDQHPGGSGHGALGHVLGASTGGGLLAGGLLTLITTLFLFMKDRARMWATFPVGDSRGRPCWSIGRGGPPGTSWSATCR